MLLLGWLMLLSAGWALGEFSERALTSVDLEVVEWVAARRTSALTIIAHTLSALGSWYVITPLAVVGCVLLYRHGLRRFAVAVALSALGAYALSAFDKLLVSRPRPPVEHLESVRSSSFPSGHVTSATGFYLALLIALLAATEPRPAIRVAAMAATASLLGGVVFSRVYLGVHYPSDVLAGLILGSCWSMLVACLIGPWRRAG
ncbi:MAG: phosphatase PAP2 family protein [Actinobacteria bacterium]|nr:phosphatase PAP2 family protein [Actinomycetota bacterium]